MVDHRITYSVRKIFAAPLPAVYDWCTDFRDDDPEIAKSTATRHIVEKGADRVIWIGTSLRGGERRAGVSIVTLLPPDSWHVDVFAKDEHLEGDYHLISLAQDQTRLDMTFRIQYKGNFATPSIEERETGATKTWENYKQALEAEIRSAENQPNPDPSHLDDVSRAQPT